MSAGRATKRDIVLALPPRRFQITSPAPQTTRLVRVFCCPEFWVLGFCLRPARPDNKRLLNTVHFLTNNPDPDTQTQSAQQNTLQTLISTGSLERARGSCPYDQKCENVPKRVLTRSSTRRSPGLRVSGSPGLRVSGSPGLRVSGSPGLRVSGSPGLRG